VVTVTQGINIVTLIIWLHVFAGATALIAGAVALLVKKGSYLHRKSGMVFVVAMLIMSATGAVTAAIMGIRISIVAGMLTFYLVLSSVLTVRPLVRAAFAVNIGVMMIGAIAGVLGLQYGLTALAMGQTNVDGYPVAAYLLFGTIALIGAALDARMIWSGRAEGIKGKHRIARHLWRMCFAMYMATSAFFLGQAQLFPEPLRHIWLLAIPVLLVLAALVYWLVRTLWTRSAPAAIS
jgi:uncharacterized membrane protein